MRLVPVYSGGAAGVDAPVAPSRPGVLTVGAAQRQLIGVRTDVVRRDSTSSVLRVPGRIAVDDTRLYRLVAATDGWIRELGRNPAGSFVAQDQILASYYVRDFEATQQNYLYAYQAYAQLEQVEAKVVPQRAAAGTNVRLALDALRSMGMSDVQIAQLQRTRVPLAEMRVYSPANGFVLVRNVSPGQRFDKGTELYRIADIGHVWVMADIFEKDREFLTASTAAVVRYRGREFHARVSDVLPQFDSQSRTFKTRFELDNPGYVLRPDMFADVDLHVEMPSAITVPADAVIETGRRKTVYVENADGSFEPRAVETGWRLGDRTQIAKGLEPGERIVVSGNFLIDSESRMKLASLGSTLPVANTAVEKDPVCGMEVDPKASDTLKTQHGGKTYYFCSSHCKKTFEANPGKYIPKNLMTLFKNGERGPA